MIRLAASHWNVPENEIESNFDPLVILMFDAVAAEMEGLGYRIQHIQDNLLNELSTIMLPQSLLRSRPASSILSAQPNDKTCTLKPDTNFATIVQTQQPGALPKEAELNFTPIGNVKLHKTSIAYLRIGNKVYKYQPDGKRSLIYENQSPSLGQEIFLVLNNPEKLETLAGLQLFFNLQGHSEAKHFYFSLQNLRLWINNSPVSTSKGYYKNDQYLPSLKDAFDKESSYSRKIQKEIAALYFEQFITIEEANTGLVLEPFSDDFCMGLPEKIVQELKKPDLLFCKVQLSRPFTQEVLERLQIGINAFPVINRKLQTVTFKTDKWINIIPLPITGSFLDVQSVEGLNGMRYKVHGHSDDQKVAEGEAIIRTVRVQKESSSDVRNTIKSLLEQIKDESAYFSHTSNDFIASRLNEMSKILTRLEDQMQVAKNIKPSFRYILLNTKSAGETITVSFWVSSPDEAAFLKPSALLRPVLHTLTTNQTFALTNAVGGMDSLSDYSQKQLLVRQLSSKGKIISVEDIKLLCYQLFGPKLKRVAVEKIMKIQPGLKEGTMRVVSISLFISKNDFPKEEELVYLEKQLKYQLDTQASFVFPFEITILDAADN